MGQTMGQSIRACFAVAVLAALTTTSFAQSIPPGIPQTVVEQVSGNIYTFRWGAYRSMFIVSSEGVIATDPISNEAAAAYREGIRSVTDLPVTHVVYSHTHWDHASGGQIFKDEGATFISQQGCIQNLEMSPNPDIVPPDITFDKTYTVTSGEEQLDLYYFGPSHDTCLIVMVSPSEKLMFTVDILTPRPHGNYMPWDPQVADFHFYNVVPYLQQMEGLAAEQNIEIVLGAHLVPRPAGKGKFEETPSTGPASSITDRRLFWERIMGVVKAEMDSGTDSFMVPNKIDVTQFKDIPGYRKKKTKELLARIASYYAIGR